MLVANIHQAGSADADLQQECALRESVLFIGTQFYTSHAIPIPGSARHDTKQPG